MSFTKIKLLLEPVLISYLFTYVHCEIMKNTEMKTEAIQNLLSQRSLSITCVWQRLKQLESRKVKQLFFFFKERLRSLPDWRLLAGRLEEGLNQKQGFLCDKFGEQACLSLPGPRLEAETIQESGESQAKFVHLGLDYTEVVIWLPTLVAAVWGPKRVYFLYMTSPLFNYMFRISGLYLK